MVLSGLYPLFLPSLGVGELSIIFIIILILFGPGKIPDVCRAMGNGLKEFKNASKDITGGPDTSASEPDLEKKTS
jgi:sec-independent protein translocase protein TatA